MDLDLVYPSNSQLYRDHGECLKGALSRPPAAPPELRAAYLQGISICRAKALKGWRWNAELDLCTYIYIQKIPKIFLYLYIYIYIQIDYTTTTHIIHPTMYICIYIYIYLYVYMYIYICTCIYKYICIYTCTSQIHKIYQTIHIFIYLCNAMI